MGRPDGFGHRVLFYTKINHKTPKVRVDKVIITPDFKYSLNLIFTPRFLAISTTIKLATEPNKVRLPAKVDESASVNQSFSGLSISLIIGLINKTAGTFDIRLLKIEDTIAKSIILFSVNNLKSEILTLEAKKEFV